MPDRERFQRVAQLFERARCRQGDARAALLAEAGGEDAELAEEVRRLLGHHDSDGGPFDMPTALTAQQFAGIARGEIGAPETIGAYRVVRLIGAGGMGAVYLAEQQSPRRMVAIKVIRPGAFSAAAHRRFELEATMLGRLRHVGIAQILEAGTYDDGVGPRPYFAMEHVDGVPLLQYDKTHRLDTRARLALIARICTAVEHAHQQGVIHRDLKPGNILVEESGQPKVLDFGVARSTDLGPHSQATKTGALLGTIGYMSPEQIDGGRDAVDTRTDIHALGVIMYELLAGRMPYDLADMSMTGALQRVRQDPPTMLGKVDPALRGDLETICSKALEKVKERRYQSASDLRDDIQRFLRNEPITARPASTVYQLRKLAQRNKPLVFAAGAVTFALVGLLVATSVAAYQISRERDEAVRAMNDATGAINFLSNVLTSLSPRKRGTPDVSLTDFLDDVSEQLDAGQLANQPSVEAAVRKTIGTAYRELGRLDHARRHLERARDLFETAGTGTPAQQAAVLSSLGALWVNTGQLERAEQTLLQAVSIFESVETDERFAMSGTLHTLATIRLEQRRIEEAEALLRQSLELHRLDPEQRPEFRARTLSSLAAALRLSGRTAEARRAYEEAITIQRRIYSEPRLDLAQTISNLVVLHMYEENLDAAQPLLQEALTIRQALLPDNHPDIASTYNSLGGLHSMRDEWHQAAEMYRQAIRIRRAANGGDHFSLATPLVNLGVAQRELGQYAEAVESLTQAVAIRRASLGAQHVKVASPLLHLARACLASGDVDCALAAAGEARTIYAGALGEEAETTLIARSVLGRGLARAHRFEEAEAILLRVDAELGALPSPSPATLRAIDRNKGWIADLQRARAAADPGGRPAALNP